MPETSHADWAMLQTASHGVDRVVVTMTEGRPSIDNRARNSSHSATDTQESVEVKTIWPPFGDDLSPSQEKAWPSFTDDLCPSQKKLDLYWLMILDLVSSQEELDLHWLMILAPVKKKLDLHWLMIFAPVKKKLDLHWLMILATVKKCLTYICWWP